MGIWGRNDLVNIEGTGNVGIGTTSPGEKLHISGGSAIIENAGVVSLTIKDSSSSQIPTINFQQGGTTKASIEGGVSLSGRMDFSVQGFSRMMTIVDGNVGIGTTTVNEKLHVNGSIRVDGTKIEALGNLAIRLDQATGSNAFFLIEDQGATARHWFREDGTAYMQGKVGIGVTSPNASLEIEGAGDSTGFRVGNTNANGTQYAWLDNTGAVATLGAVNTQNATFPTMKFTVTNNATTSERMRINSGGNIGIGTTNPLTKLHVEADDPLLRLKDSDSGNPWDLKATSQLKILDNSVERMVFDNNGNMWMAHVAGNVGIGTTGPAKKLHIEGGMLRVDSADTSADYIEVSDMRVQVTRSGSSAGMELETLGSYTGTGGYIDFNPKNVTAMRVAQDGNVGIGTTNPTEKLQVVGSIKLTGRIRQGSLGDVAEMMEISPIVLAQNTSGMITSNVSLEALRGDEAISEITSTLDMLEAMSDSSFIIPGPADVVAIDMTGGIKLTDEANTTRVIGVVSTNPAQILMEDLPNSVPVALSGTVPCKVTTENGPIYPGDMLVASSKPGYAMKAIDPKPGSIIGKAVECLEQGDGEILIFVTRQ